MNAIRDLLLEADHAERIGDHSALASLLREHLAQHGDDAGARLRLGRLLIALGEPRSARQVLQPLDGADNLAALAEANRLLARLDETEGQLESAQVRWERALADDVDDPEAHARLRELGRQAGEGRVPASLSVATLVSPEGIRMSRFKLVRELGRGSSGAVYLVRDDRLDLPLALKVLHPQLAAASRAAARERFFAEARVAAALRHPGVVAIYGVDEVSRCLVMEYVPGGTLRERLRAAAAERMKGAGGGSGAAIGAGAAGAPPSLSATGLDAAEVLATARALLGALAHVHRAGIVHGDLKPGNLLMRRPGEVVLADFGVAQFMAAGAGAEERPAGTPLYLAPEQFRGAPASVATDLFAAGAILWELVQGRPARRQSDLLKREHDRVPPLPIEAFAELGDRGANLHQLIMALLAPDPKHRPPDATAALALLQDRADSSP